MRREWPYYNRIYKSIDYKTYISWYLEKYTGRSTYIIVKIDMQYSRSEIKTPRLQYFHVGKPHFMLH